MKKLLIATMFLMVPGSAQSGRAETSFEKVSDHCYFLHVEESGENIAIVVSVQGTLLFDPPPEPDLSVLVESMKTLPRGPVRWMIDTGFYFAQTAGIDYFARNGAVFLAGFRQQAPRPPVSAPAWIEAPAGNSDEFSNAATIPSSDWDESIPADSGDHPGESFTCPRFTFKRQMYLFPDDLEIRIQALQQEARTGADIFAYVPDEKVLFVGRLFEPSRYPDIDVSSGGGALKWVDALEQVIRSVPLLISAIPTEEEEAKEAAPAAGEEKEKGAGEAAEEEKEKTLEEMVAVIPSRGELSNLQMMKDMLDTSKKLRKDISREVKAGRSCERYLDSPRAEPYRIYGNFFPFATQMCRELSPAAENTKPKPGSKLKP
jgi:hypothetical protein